MASTKSLRKNYREGDRLRTKYDRSKCPVCGYKGCECDDFDLHLPGSRVKGLSYAQVAGACL